MHKKGGPIADWGLAALLAKFPKLRLRPQVNGPLLISGTLEFETSFQKRRIADAFAIEIEVPDSFPSTLPKVKETAGRIPQTFHHYPDGSLCLGSPIGMAMEVGRNPDLLSFVELLVVPYLYGYAHLLQFGELPFGDLDHGHEGVVQDLERRFGITSEKRCLELLTLAGYVRRKANRQKCPCGSGLRVGRCHNQVLNRFRARVGRLECRYLAKVVEQKFREKTAVLALRVQSRNGFRF